MPATVKVAGPNSGMIMPAATAALAVVLVPAARGFPAVFLNLGFIHTAALRAGYLVAVLSAGGTGRLFPSFLAISTLKYSILHVVISSFKYDLMTFHQSCSYFESGGTQNPLKCRPGYLHRCCASDLLKADDILQPYRLDFLEQNPDSMGIDLVLRQESPAAGHLLNYPAATFTRHFFVPPIGHMLIYSIGD
jgi:hypothetical protein